MALGAGTSAAVFWALCTRSVWRNVRAEPKIGPFSGLAITVLWPVIFAALVIDVAAYRLGIWWRERRRTAPP